MQPEFLAAFIIGFFGSLHCVGMCGPIALVSPALFPGTMGRIISGLIYNSGRIITYSIIGAIFGLLGKGLFIFKWQQVVSISIGILIILFVLVPSLFKRPNIGTMGMSLSAKVKRWMSKFLKQKSFLGIWSIGLVNGLLPCGLVYLALAGSLDQGSVPGAMTFMAFFGLGTIPMMTGMHLLGNNLKGSFKNKLSKILPVFIFLMGLLFILRGLGLGIPYVSPSMDPHTGDIECTVPSHRHINGE